MENSIPQRLSQTNFVLICDLFRGELPKFCVFLNEAIIWLIWDLEFNANGSPIMCAHWAKRLRIDCRTSMSYYLCFQKITKHTLEHKLVQYTCAQFEDHKQKKCSSKDRNLEFNDGTNYNSSALISWIALHKTDSQFRSWILCVTVKMYSSGRLRWLFLSSVFHRQLFLLRYTYSGRCKSSFPLVWLSVLNARKVSLDNLLWLHVET